MEDRSDYDYGEVDQLEAPSDFNQEGLDNQNDAFVKTIPEKAQLVSGIVPPMDTNEVNLKLFANNINFVWYLYSF